MQTKRLLEAARSSCGESRTPAETVESSKEIAVKTKLVSDSVCVFDGPLRVRPSRASAASQSTRKENRDALCSLLGKRCG